MKKSKIIIISSLSCLFIILALFFLAFSGIFGKSYHSLANDILGKAVNSMDVFDEIGLSKEGGMNLRYIKYSSAINSMRFCLHDSMCGVVPDGPCGCNNGGKNIGINKVFSGAAKMSHMIIYSGIACVGMMSDDPSCKPPVTCKEFKCTIEPLLQP